MSGRGMSMDTNGFRLAQQWHADHHMTLEGGWISYCWCCCTDCDPDWGGNNPWFRAALAEQRDAPLAP